MKRMNFFVVSLLVGTIVALFTGCSYYDAQYHRFATSPWEEQYAHMQRDWEMLTTSDSAWAEREFPEAGIYTDATGKSVRIYGDAMVNNYGYPLTINEYRYINADGLIKVNHAKIWLDILWYFSVFLSLPLCMVLILTLLIKKRLQNKK
ncbi:MAG: hypothetical protein ACI30J_06445 [Paludibacteraceae bacterium]